MSRVTAETLDLDKLLANVADHRQGSGPLRSVRHPALQRAAQGLRIRYSIGHREEIVRNLVVALGEGITGAAAASTRSRCWWTMSARTRAI